MNNHITQRKNIIGHRFGNLVAIEQIENDKWGHPIWKCQCDCGNNISLIQYNLINKVKSCGCSRRNDLVGQRFGKLVVISMDYTNKRCYWKCKCDCGNIKSICGSSLVCGRTKSCGCLIKEPRKSHPEQANTHIGEKHYFLTITGIEQNTRRNQHGYLMSCQCDCGNITRQHYADIVNGKVKSCGCHQKEQISITGSKCGLNNCSGNGKNHKWFLIENGVKKKARSGYEVIFSMCMNKQHIPFQYEPKTFILKKGMRYTPDFYLPQTNEWIETKGFLKPIAIEKMNEFKKQGNKLKLVELKELEKMIGCCYITFLRRWDKGLYAPIQK